MGRTVAVLWHTLSSLGAGALYFLFVLPRWWELMGDTSHTLGTVLRIVTGALIALAALPVVVTFLRSRKPEYGTPRLAQNLRVWSIVGHVLAGALIIVTAIAEIWVSLDTAGQWLFGSYGAAAAIALLGVLAFYLAFVAELPPAPPKPIKPKKAKKRRDTEAGESQGETESVETAEPGDADEPEREDTGTDVEESGAEEKPAEVTAATEADAEDVAARDDGDSAPAGTGALRNRRPSGKSGARRRRRSRGGVAVDD